MSADAPLVARWDGHRLLPVDAEVASPHKLVVADSWLVAEGRVLSLDVHRQRFLRTATDPDAVGAALAPAAAAFWDAAIAAIPRHGSWFPRVEAQRNGDAVSFWARVRPAPELTRSVVVRSLAEDPRRVPTVKGPDLARLIEIGGQARGEGIGESVVLAPDGAIVEGLTTSLMWWRGDAIGMPDADLDRIDSVTARIVETLATARGIPVLRERLEPAALEGLEVWALNALHGPRIVRKWVDGPAVAELPGRLEEWRRLLQGLRQPLPSLGTAHPV